MDVLRGWVLGEWLDVLVGWVLGEWFDVLERWFLCEWLDGCFGRVGFGCRAMFYTIKHPTGNPSLSHAITHPRFSPGSYHPLRLFQSQLRIISDKATVSVFLVSQTRRR